MMTTADIIAAAERHGPPAVALVQRAIELACEVHRGVCRRNGDPYIVHPLAVAGIVAELGADPDTIVAALLHDVIDDAEYPLDEVRAGFGDTVATILQEVAALDYVDLYPDDADQHIRELSRSDHRAITLKLADRLHNMQTISGLSEDKQYGKARETFQVIAPVARMVGLDDIAMQLDALSTEILRRSGIDRAAVAEPWAGETGLRRTRTLLHLAARLFLPRLARERWLAEWDGEIAALPGRGERLRFTAGLITGLPQLAADAHRARLPGMGRRNQW